VVPVPVPVVIVAPPVVIVAPVVAPEAQPQPVAAAPDAVLPQFAPFLVAPMLLQASVPLLVVAPVAPVPMRMVMVQAPELLPVAAPALAPPAPIVAPAAAPARAPARPAKPYRN
jgi:hypothetical protein